jgi:hypothetical protein
MPRSLLDFVLQLRSTQIYEKKTQLCRHRKHQQKTIKESEKMSSKVNEIASRSTQMALAPWRNVKNNKTRQFQLIFKFTSLIRSCVESRPQKRASKAGCGGFTELAVTKTEKAGVESQSSARES